MAHIRPATIIRAQRATVVGYATPPSQCIEWVENAANDYEYGVLTGLPTDFGAGEFTCQQLIKLDDGYSVGATDSGAAERQNWYNGNPTPYSAADWWYEGNFFLDGHNNEGGAFYDGTYSIQFFNGGRPRWLFGDGSAADARVGDVHAVQNANWPTLLDGRWHWLTQVRRWDGGTGSILELWIDGALAATETSTLRTNMYDTYWTGDSWSSFPQSPNQEGWFWGAEKQAALDILSQYEDYKGLQSELRFWNRALSTAEINAIVGPASGNESGLSGLYRFREQTGTTAGDDVGDGGDITLVNGVGWDAEIPFATKFT